MVGSRETNSRLAKSLLSVHFMLPWALAFVVISTFVNQSEHWVKLKSYFGEANPSFFIDKPSYASQFFDTNDPRKPIYLVSSSE